ncbi:MAG TPA: orotidine-5'-phosphate decarboxylase [Syntrophomonadaceae bacterium]|nr:orotidine-5'-phosphate decarboxylase [Syntrophomonadaceae bacterium]HPR93693.1 orotidine-5'-phosphate decarboxylase [Syntrophomonadaceae bacterium]
MQAKEKIILALDVDNLEKALDLVRELKDHVGMFKVGMELYYSTGPDIVKRINDLGGKVFVDLKLHDIPNTAGGAGRALTRLNCAMFNVHAAGGFEMMQKTKTESADEAAKLGITPPLLLAVTVLTSIAQQQLQEEMMVKDLSVADLVVKWALLAQKAGMDGVVSSPREIELIRSACGPGFKIVTPGIRPAWSEAGDQKRITTPKQALEKGTDYMVIGRPITKAENPKQAALKIIEELES